MQSWRTRLTILLALLPLTALAQSSAGIDQSSIILALAAIIGGASISWLVIKINFPSVIGELAFGILLAALAHYHLGFWNEIINNPSIALLAELGSILLLFEIGLESNVNDLVSSGKHGIVVALLGIALPFILGSWLVAEFIFASEDIKLNLFIGATLAATSTGISVRVFKDLGILRNPACQIVLTASIIDDILGLIILTIVSGVVISGSVNILGIGHILLNVIGFFIFAFVVARKVTPKIINVLLRINKDEPMVVAALIAFCLLLAWVAHAIGLAAIIGAFVAGLILDEILFRNSTQPQWYQKIVELHNNNPQQTVNSSFTTQLIEHHHSERLINLIKPINYILVPIFFVYAGMQLDIVTVLNWNTLVNGMWLSLAAIGGKLVCGIFLPKSINRWIVGFGMVPRGEIGLIFAMSGRQLGVFNDEIFAAILLMVIVTSLVTPLGLQLIAKRTNA